MANRNPNMQQPLPVEWNRAHLVSTIEQLTNALADARITVIRAEIERQLAATRHALDCLDTLSQTRIGA